MRLRTEDISGERMKERRRERLDFVGWWTRASRDWARLDDGRRSSITHAAALRPGLLSQASCTTHDPEPTGCFAGVSGLAMFPRAMCK